MLDICFISHDINALASVSFAIYQTHIDSELRVSWMPTQDGILVEVVSSCAFWVHIIDVRQCCGYLREEIGLITPQTMCNRISGFCAWVCRLPLFYSYRKVRGWCTIGWHACLLRDIQLTILLCPSIIHSLALLWKIIEKISCDRAAWMLMALRRKSLISYLTRLL